MDGDPLGGIAGSLVCPTVCDGCEGPFQKGGEHVVVDRRGTGTMFRYYCNKPGADGRPEMVRVDNGLDIVVVLGVPAIVVLAILMLYMVVSLMYWRRRWNRFIAENPDFENYESLR